MVDSLTAIARDNNLLNKMEFISDLEVGEIQRIGEMD